MRAVCFLVVLVLAPALSRPNPIPLVGIEGLDCIRVTPDGSFPIQGTLMDLQASQPLPFMPLRLIFDPACTHLRQCPLPGTTPTVLSTVTDANGEFSLGPRIGGCCEAPAAVVFEADPGAVTVGLFASVGSPDNTGDLVVSLADFVNFAAVFNTDDECNDVDGSCDGRVILSDLVAFGARFGASCP